MDELNIKNKVNINSLIISILLMITPLNMGVSKLLGVSDSLLPLFFGLLLIWALIYNKNMINSIKVYSVYFSIGIFVFLTFFMYEANSYLVTYVFNFIVVFTISSYVIMNDFDLFKLYKYITILLMIIIPVGIEVMSNLSFTPENKLGFIYSVLPAYFILLTSIFIPFNFLLRMISFVDILFWTIFYINIGNRGAFLSMFVFAVLLLLTVKVIPKILKVIILVVSIAIFYFSMSNLSEILNWLNRILVSRGLNINFIQKSIYFLNKGDLGNGRDFFFDSAIYSIQKSPFFGNGIGFFESTYGNYPHNIFLQVLVESGFFGLLFLLTLVIYFLKLQFFSEINEISKLTLLSLFSSTIIPLMVSKTYWTTFGFWVFVSMLLFLLKENRNSLESRKFMLE